MFFPSLVLSCWYLAIGHDKHIYTTEVGKGLQIRALFILKKFLNFIYLSLAALGLCCCCGKRGLPSHYGDFSCCRAQILGCTGSVVVAHGA